MRKQLLCIQDLTLNKAVQHIRVDEATSSQADMFLTKVNKTITSAYRQKKYPHNTEKRDQSSPAKDENLRKCKFCTKYHVFKKEFRPAKDSVCKDCQNKGHWACVSSPLNQPVTLLAETRKLLMNLLSLLPSRLNQLLKSFQLVSTTTLTIYLVPRTGTTVSVMIGLPALTHSSGHIILNVVLPEATTWMSKPEFSLRFHGLQKSHHFC